MSNRPLPPAAADLRVALYEDGLSFREIAWRVERSYQSVAQFLTRHGYHTPLPRRRRSDADRRRVADWYNRLYPVSVICAHFGIAACTVYDDLRRLNVPLRYPKMSAAHRAASTRIEYERNQ